MNLEAINKRLRIVSDLEQELNKVKALLDESLEDDPQYQEIQDESAKVKEHIKQKKTTVLEKTENKHLAERIKEMRDEIKENREVLSQELADYYKDSGSLEIVDPEGNTKRIKFSVKLISS